MRRTTAIAFCLSAVSLVLLSLVRGQALLPVLEECVFYLAGLMTAGAGLQYVYRGLRWVQYQEEAKG